jgi:hypothetical protein
VVVGDCALAKREAGVGGWAKTHNRAAVARLRVCCVRRQRGIVCRVVRWCIRGDGGGGGLCAHETQGGGGGLGQNSQLSCRGSAAGAPCGMVAGDGA